MKKLLLFIMMASLSVGCKEKAEKEQETKAVQTSLNPPANCVNYLIINKSLITDVDSDEWLEKNENYICDESDTTQNDIYIDLTKIGIDINSQAVGDWLKANGKYIDFTNSYENIRKMHLIATTPTADANVNEVKLSLSEIKAEIALDTTVDYAGDKYDKYIKFTMQKDPTTNIDKVVIDVVDDFAPDCKCFSIPFLRSIEAFETGDPDFYFNMGKFGSEPTSNLYFKVGSKFYNYTRVPLGH